MNEMAELASHATYRTVEVLAGNSTIVLRKGFESHETVLKT